MGSPRLNERPVATVAAELPGPAAPVALPAAETGGAMAFAATAGCATTGIGTAKPWAQAVPAKAPVDKASTPKRFKKYNEGIPFF